MIVVVHDQKSANVKTIEQKHNLTTASFQLLSLILMQPQHQNAALPPLSVLLHTNDGYISVFHILACELSNKSSRWLYIWHAISGAMCKKSLPYLIFDPLLPLSSGTLACSQFPLTILCVASFPFYCRVPPLSFVLAHDKKASTNTINSRQPLKLFHVIYHKSGKVPQLYCTTKISWQCVGHLSL